MRLASRGLRDMDAGEEPIGDASERAVVRRQATRVHAKAIAFGVLLTALALLLPADWGGGNA